MSSHRKKIIGGLLVVLVFVAVAVSVKHLVGGSATGTISTGSGTKNALADTTALEAEQGSYASFNRPSYLTPVKSEPAVSPVLINYNFVKSQFGSWQMAIQIANLSTGSLDDNGSYHYRKTMAQQYAFSTRTINGQNVPVATDKTLGGYNEIAYLTNGSKVATISLMGGDGQDVSELNDALTTVLTSWQWR